MQEVADKASTSWARMVLVIEVSTSAGCCLQPALWRTEYLLLAAGRHPTQSGHLCGCRAYRWDRFYAGLLAGPRRPKIELYQGERQSYGALGISRITGLTGPSIRWLALTCILLEMAEMRFSTF